MGSLHISLTSTERLHWPSHCAACGAPADNEAFTSISTSKNFQYYGVLLRWTQRIFSLSFPVCKKHKMICRLLDIPARLGFIKGSLYLFLVPSMLWVVTLIIFSVVTGLKGDALDPFSIAFGVLFYGSAVLLYVAAMTIKPVKLSALNESSLTVSIRNNDYFNEFQRLNSGS